MRRRAVSTTMAVSSCGRRHGSGCPHGRCVGAVPSQAANARDMQYRSSLAAGAEAVAPARATGAASSPLPLLKPPLLCSRIKVERQAPARQQLPALEMHHPSSPFSSVDATRLADALCNTLVLCDMHSTQAAAAQHSQAAQLQTSGHNISPTQHAAGSDMSPAVAAV